MDNYKWMSLVTVMIGLFMAVLDSSIVNVATSHMAATFSTNTDRIRWVVECYALAYAIFTLTMSWIRERIGIKNTFMTGLILFTTSSALCGVAWNLETMILFRVLQGIGGGIMLPTGFTIISESFPPSQRGSAFGIFGIVVVLAPSLGPTLGGWLVDNASWRYIFYINMPVGVVAIAMCMTILKEHKKLEPHPFDFVGFAGLATFLSCLLITMTDGLKHGWNSDFIVGLLVLSVVGLAVFIVGAPKAVKPIIDISIFKNFYFSVIAILNIMRSIALFGRLFLLPIFFQNMIGYSATFTGLLLSPGAMISGIVMPISGPLVDKYGPRFFIFSGLVLLGISNLMYYNLEATTPYSTILWAIIIFGLGSGLLNTPITATAMNVVRKDQISQVSTVLSVLMQVGGAFGVAMLGTIMNNRSAFHQAVYADSIKPYSYMTDTALNGIQSLGTRIGESQLLAEMQAPAVLNGFVSRQAAIAGFQDAFIYTGVLCFVGLIPALALFKLRATGKKAGPVPAE